MIIISEVHSNYTGHSPVETDSRTAGLELPCLYKAWRLIAVFTKDRHYVLSQTRRIQSTASRLIKL